MSKKQQFAMTGARGEARGAMAFRRGPAGNHVEPRTRDKWERQADEAARRILRGERNVARMLTPAPAASLTLPLSSGAPLPRTLRAELEESFGADLSAVRIHRDAAAAAASRNENAFAFASGRDIYFDQGPDDSASSRRLLLHEVAHVLQQTGRVSSGGRLSATPHKSTGSIQRAEIPDFATLRKLHSPAKKDAPENPKFTIVADELAKQVAATDPAAALEEYFRESKEKIKDWPAEAESLFYDTLKRFEKFDLAAQLIARNDFQGGIRIRTAAWSGETVAELERQNHGSAVYVKAAEKHPVLSFYVEEFVRLIEVFIFQPLSAPVPKMRRFGVKEGDAAPQTIEDHLIELGKRLEDNTKLSSSEWVYKALYTIDQLNDLRRARCVEIFNTANAEAKKTNELSGVRKRRLAEGIRDWGNDFLASTSKIFANTDRQKGQEEKSSWEPFLKKLGARIAATGQTALDVWDRKQAIDEILHAYDVAAAKDNVKGVADAMKRLAGLSAAGKKSGLPDLLIHVVGELNRRGAHQESPPDIAEYRARSRDLAKKLDEFSEANLEKQQAKLFRDKKTDELVADIWLAIWLDRLASNLRWMAGGTDLSPNVALVDQRIVQRIRLARKIQYLSEAVGWTDVAKGANVILEAQAEPKSQLAILPFADGKYWHKDETAKIENLADIKAIAGWEPLKGEHLALLYNKDYYDKLADKIEELAPVTDSQEQQLVKSGGLIPFLAGRANNEVRKLPHPERWKVASYEIAQKKDRKENLADLIQQHHSFGEINIYAGQTGRTWILPTSGAPRVWFIPPIETVIPTLREIDLLNEQVAAALPGREPASRKLEQTRKLDDSDWFQKLLKHIASQLKSEKMSREKLQDMRDMLREALREKEKQSWKSLLEAVKKGSRLDRQLIAKMSASHLIEFHDKRFLNEAENALEPIIRFLAAVSMLEDSDIDAEMAALFLELAPELDVAFSSEDRFDVVHSYLGFLESVGEYLPTLEKMDPKQRHVFLPDYENTSAWITPRAARLRTLTEHFQQVRAEVQKKGGYKASISDKGIKVFMAGSSIIPLSTKLYPREGPSIIGEPKDTHYLITKILRDFIYHPAYGYSVASGDKKKQRKEATSGYAPAKFNELDDQTPLALKPGEKLLEVRIFKRQGGSAKRSKGASNDQVVGTRQVGTEPEDADIMADIYNGLTWAAFGSEMANIQAAIGWYVNTVLDLAEFIPGVGQAITATRVLATIAQFWADGDYQDLKKFVGDEIRNVVESLLQRIKEAADPENLVQLLLFGDPRLDELLARVNVGKEKEPVPEDSPKKQGRLAKVINAFRRLGRGLFRVLRAVHKWIEVPMEDVRAFVTSRPILSFALQFIADNIFTLAEIAKKGISFFGAIGDKADRKKEAAEELKSSLKDQQADLGEHVHGILKSLEKLELPDTILHIEPIIAWFVTKLEGFVVGSLGLKARAAFLLLKASGGLAFFNDRLAAEIVEAGVDPNIYWREQIVPKIADRFNETRDTVVKEINGVLGSKVFGGVFQPVPPAEKVTLQPEGGPFEETGEDYVPPAPEAGAAAQPYPSPDRPLRLRPPGLGGYGPGLPLQTGLRRRVESVFGQDFSHVRLHTGSESDKMTAAFGVDGLATGSHIFLRPGLSPESGQGSEIFHHELVHVLQQTGVRPLGGPAGPQPVAGHPELGLDYDPLRERVADRVASMVRSGNRPALSSTQSGDETGLQPAGLKLSTVANILHSFTDLEAIKRTEETIDKMSEAAKEEIGTNLPPRAKSTVNGILKVLKDLNGNASILKYPGVFTDAVPLIHNRLSNPAYAEPIRLAAYQIANEALEPLPVPKPPKGAKAQPPAKADSVLKPAHFARQLEEFILAKTGIVLGLKLNRTKVTAPSGKEVTTVDDQNPVQQIKILHIYLPYIDGRSPLWINAINNTWTGLSDKQLEKVRIHARAHFERKGIEAAIWALIGKKYEFSFIFKREVDELVKASVTGVALDPKDLPSPDEYPKTDKNIPSPIGVRLATYDDQSQKGAGRHSHHLTQYLLADYFANTNKTKPFIPGRDYPGVTWTKDGVDLISPQPGASENASIRVAKTKGEGRGKDMPTISLAASTHLSANLHLTQDPDDLPGTTKKVQGAWVHEQFSSQLPAEFFAKDEKVFQQYKADKTDAQLAKSIYDAAQFTYRAVVERMSKKLQTRMPEFELQYYKVMAEGTRFDLRDKTNPEVVTHEEEKFKAALEKVPPIAKKHNEDIMRDSFGWTVK